MCEILCCGIWRCGILRLWNFASVEFCAVEFGVVEFCVCGILRVEFGVWNFVLVEFGGSTLLNISFVLAEVVAKFYDRFYLVFGLPIPEIGTWTRWFLVEVAFLIFRYTVVATICNIIVALLQQKGGGGW